MAKKRRQIAARSVLWCIVAVKSGFGVTGGVCRFHPSCSRYAYEAICELPLWRAVGLIVWRIVRCNPFAAGGADPVPQKQ